MDAKIDVVESADLNGGNRRIIQDKDIVHPFGTSIKSYNSLVNIEYFGNLNYSLATIELLLSLIYMPGATLFGSEILWTDWGRRSVEAANKDGTLCILLAVFT